MLFCRRVPPDRVRNPTLSKTSACLICFGICSQMFEANATYVLYVLYITLSPLAALLLLDYFVRPYNASLIDSVSNRRHMQLVVFLTVFMFLSE